MWYFYLVQLFVVYLYVFYFVNGFVVVDVGVDEDVIVLIVQYGYYVFDYLCDDVCFYLGWYYDGDGLFIVLLQLFYC